MNFSFAPDSSKSFIDSFSETYGIPIINNTVTIPESLGRGFIKCINIDEGIRMVLHHFTLTEDFRIQRLSPVHPTSHISLVFNSTEKLIRAGSEHQDPLQQSDLTRSSIQISSTSLETESFFPANSEIHFTAIGMNVEVLKSLIKIEKTNALIENILKNQSTFFYHESLDPEFLRILKQLIEINDQDKLSLLYYKIKILELVYLLFGKLLKRDTYTHSSINKADLEKIYKLRSSLIANLGTPPSLEDLASLINMSETKMKQLFKQTFGDTIYNYFQKLRMDEAAFLLKQAGYSVSEVGYQLGFSNMSHFSKTFEKHYGITPKKYALVG